MKPGYYYSESFGGILRVVYPDKTAEIYIEENDDWVSMRTSALKRFTVEILPKTEQAIVLPGMNSFKFIGDL